MERSRISSCARDSSFLPNALYDQGETEGPQVNRSVWCGHRVSFFRCANLWLCLRFGLLWLQYRRYTRMRSTVDYLVMVAQRRRVSFAKQNSSIALNFTRRYVTLHLSDAGWEGKGRKSKPSREIGDTRREERIKR